jgi:hypothetical protein
MSIIIRKSFDGRRKAAAGKFLAIWDGSSIVLSLD